MALQPRYTTPGERPGSAVTAALVPEELTSPLVVHVVAHVMFRSLPLRLEHALKVIVVESVIILGPPVIL